MPSQDLSEHATLDCIDIPADALRAADVRNEFHFWLVDGFRLDAEQLSSMTLAVNEALANVVEHAYAGGADSGTVDLNARYVRGRGELVVVVADHGHWREIVPDPLGLRGRGIPLMDGLTEELSITRTDTGTTVRLRWIGISALG